MILCHISRSKESWIIRFYEKANWQDIYFLLGFDSRGSRWYLGSAAWETWGHCEKCARSLGQACMGFFPRTTWSPFWMLPGKCGVYYIYIVLSLLILLFVIFLSIFLKSERTERNISYFYLYLFSLLSTDKLESS